MRVLLLRLMLVAVAVSALAGCGGNDAAPLAPTATATTVSFTSALPIVIGSVYDTASRPLSGVRVEVLDGPQTGVATVSDAQGRFLLQGIFDSTTRFRGSKQGFLDDTVMLTPECMNCPLPTSNRYLYPLHLPLDAPPVSVAGDYILAIDADERCDTLPEVARSRRFAVTVAPAERGSQRFTIRLPGAFAGYDWFGFGVAGTHLSGWLGHDGPLVVEQLAPNVYVGFDGGFEATLDVSPAQVIAARYNGTISYCVRHAPAEATYSCAPADAAVRGECVSTNHRVTLVRR